MPEQLDPVVAENLASGAMRHLPLTLAKRQLQECLMEPSANSGRLPWGRCLCARDPVSARIARVRLWTGT
jgi:hypothetical protein